MAEAERVKSEPPSGVGSAPAAVAPHPSPGSTAPDAVDPLVGKVIDGRFRILSLLARGGMGRVYRAEQIQLGRVCAVKVLHPKYTGDRDPEFARRFFLEAKIASQLTHPNTVTIFDYGQAAEEDVFYMAMELLEGVTLHRAIRTEAPFPAERVAYIGRQICRSLREAHRLGVIHRDLKPANVILTVHGDEPDFAKVLDFGLVKQIEGAIEELTQTGLFMGSPKYMAPEAIRGDAVDARADVYSLGVIMYEMTCGKVPFEKSNSLGTLMAHVNDAPPPLEAMCPGLDVPPELAETIFGCLAKDPQDRFSSMDDVLASLKRIGPGGGMAHTGEYRTGAPPGVSSYMSSHPPPSISGAQAARPLPLTRPRSPSEPPAETLEAPRSLLASLDSEAQAEPSGSSGPSRSGPSSKKEREERGQRELRDAEPTRADEALAREAREASESEISEVGSRSSRVPTSQRIGPARRERASALWGIAGGAAVVLAVFLVMWARGDRSDRGFGGSGVQPLAVVTATGGPAAPATSAASTSPTVRSVDVLPLAVPVPSSSASTASGAPVAPVALRVTSDPPGAQVRENGVELCTSTPCDVVFRGDAAAAGLTHRLIVARAGYRVETATVHSDDGAVTVHLTRAGVPGVSPAANNGNGNGNANGNGNGTKSPSPSSSGGFKEIPY